MRSLLAAPLAAVLVLGVSAPVVAQGRSHGHGHTHGHHGHGHHDGSYARHAPRPGLTDQDFYFVMGDRFANGDTGNDTGGLGDDRLVSGFDPTSKGFYNGGDLKGLKGKDIYELPPDEMAEIEQVPTSLNAVLDALEADQDYLTVGNVFTPDLIETWIDYKRTNEIAPVQLRPHPHEFELYYDI